MDARLEIVERHPHTQIIPGSAAQFGRDATVAWNYVDLRFKSREDLALEVSLTSKDLIVRLRSKTPAHAKLTPLRLVQTARPVLKADEHSCPSCGESECFRHAAAQRLPFVSDRSAFVLNEVWSEFKTYIEQTHGAEDILLLPIDGSRFNQPRYAWPTRDFTEVHA